MTIAISYIADYGSWSVSSYLADWSDFFSGAVHGSAASGNGVFSPGVFSGTQYGVKSTETTGSYIATGDLHYGEFNYPDYSVFGSLDSVVLGSDLQGIASTGFTQDAEVGFSQLGLQSLAAERGAGVVNQVVEGLTRGDSMALQSVLEALFKAVDPGLSLNSTFDELAAAGLAHVTAGAADVGLVGVPQGAQDWALAA